MKLLSNNEGAIDGHDDEDGNNLRAIGGPAA
jgi:hypothetical protein